MLPAWSNKSHFANPYAPTLHRDTQREEMILPFFIFTIVYMMIRAALSQANLSSHYTIGKMWSAGILKILSSLKISFSMINLPDLAEKLSTMNTTAGGYSASSYHSPEQTTFTANASVLGNKEQWKQPHSNALCNHCVENDNQAASILIISDGTGQAI